MKLTSAGCTQHKDEQTSVNDIWEYVNACQLNRHNKRRRVYCKSVDILCVLFRSLQRTGRIGFLGRSNKHLIVARHSHAERESP